MPIPGRLEVTVKFSQMPAEVQPDSNGWKTFILEAEGGMQVSVTLKPKVFRKLEEAQATFTNGWVAAVTGKFGQVTAHGFVLAEPNLQVFERKPKPIASDTAAGTQ
jgi:hypothetical protein